MLVWMLVGVSLKILNFHRFTMEEKGNCRNSQSVHRNGTQALGNLSKRQRNSHVPNRVRRKYAMDRTSRKKRRVKKATEVSTTRSLYPIHRWREWYIYKQPRIGYADEWRAFKEGFTIASKSLRLIFKEIRRVECSAELKHGVTVDNPL